MSIYPTLVRSSALMEARYRQVLTNLVTNAWEAVEKNHGSIGLAVKVVSSVDLSVTRRFPIDWQPHGITLCLSGDKRWKVSG